MIENKLLLWRVIRGQVVMRRLSRTGQPGSRALESLHFVEKYSIEKSPAGTGDRVRPSNQISPGNDEVSHRKGSIADEIGVSRP